MTDAQSRWTQEEINALRALSEEVDSPVTIARLCIANGWKRSENAIELKIHRLRTGKVRDPLPHTSVFGDTVCTTRTFYDPPLAAPDSYHPTARNRSEAPAVVGVVGDLHLPFTLPDYLGFCRETFDKWGVTRVVFIGDVIDNHASSYHETDPDGMSAGDEMWAAKEALEGWFKAFPEAVWILGNHDKIPMRKVMSAGLSRHVLRENIYGHPPGWQTCESATIDGVLYTHGLGASGLNGHRNLAQRRGVSCVVGHYHRTMGVEYMPTHDGKHRFGVATGCGFDSESYAAAYGRDHGRMALGCAVVRYGREAYSIPMLNG